MEKEKNKMIDPVMIMFFVMVGIIGVIIVYLTATKNVPNYNKLFFDNSITDLTWLDENGNKVEDIKNLIESGLDNHIIRLQVPRELPENVSLCFRNKHVLFKAYVDGECIFYQELPESRLYTNSVGANWIMIPMKQAYAGKEITVEYELCYKERGCGFDYMVIGSERAFLVHVIWDKMFALITPFIYLVVGCILILMDMLLGRLTSERHKFFSLGWLAIGVASYCMAETQIFPIFITNQKIMHLVPIYAMAIVPIPVFAYADALFHFKYRHTSLICSSISFGLFVVLTILNFFDVWDFHDSMTLFHIMLLSSMIMMTYALIRFIVLQIRAKKPIALHIRYTIIGLVSVVFCGCVDIIRYWLRDNQDPAKYVRIGFLIFLFCFTIASSEQILDAFKNSTKNKLVARLAYEDGLTGLKNRTSYNEALEEINETRRDTGIVMMDVNNLKYVNDNFGHDAGDSMLIYASEIIKDAFKKEGMTCYRIGGDEFVVLVQTDKIKEDCEEAIDQLRKKFEEFNQTTVLDFKIVIAAGYQVFEKHKLEALDDIIKVADSIMYMDKKRLKEKKQGLM